MVPAHAATKEHKTNIASDLRCITSLRRRAPRASEKKRTPNARNMSVAVESDDHLSELRAAIDAFAHDFATFLDQKHIVDPNGLVARRASRACVFGLV